HLMEVFRPCDPTDVSPIEVADAATLQDFDGPAVDSVFSQEVAMPVHRLRFASEAPHLIPVAGLAAVHRAVESIECDPHGHEAEEHVTPLDVVAQGQSVPRLD